LIVSVLVPVPPEMLPLTCAAPPRICRLLLPLPRSTARLLLSAVMVP